MAVSLTAIALRDALTGDTGGPSDDEAAHLLAVATATVEQRAPVAPEAVQDEAVIRFAGGLFDTDSATGAATSAPDAGSFAVPRGPSILRTSGALAVLAPFIVHRAGVCEAE